MEGAPLTNAHIIARDVFNDIHSSAAKLIEQHQSAAVEFHNAAQGIDDSEALRVLALLEEHHRRLAHIVKSHAEPPNLQVNDGSDTAKNALSTVIEDPGQAQSTGTTSGPRQSSPVRSRRPPRDITSSIASNLASARGIPSQYSSQRSRQTSPTGPAQGTRNSQSAFRNSGSAPDSRQSTTLAKPSGSQASAQSLYQPPPKPSNDDSFNKFYNTFEGLLSKISAPLAFAGLPLQPEESSSSTPSRSALASRTTVTSDDPAISRLFSKAALRAVKDNEGSSGVQDSFFVVPTTGGTESYAGVLSSQAHASAGHRRIPSTASDTQDQFVDARETQIRPPSSTSAVAHSSSRRGSVAASVGGAPPSTRSSKTLEELELENASLKQLTDKLSSRLYDWEKNSQNQSMALQQSIRNLQAPQSQPASRRPQRAQEGTNQALQGQRNDQEMAMLEEALAHAQKDLERYGRENEKLKSVVIRYRERWEKLKEGARVRREGAERDKEKEMEGKTAPDATVADKHAMGV